MRTFLLLISGSGACLCLILFVRAELREWRNQRRYKRYLTLHHDRD